MLYWRVLLWHVGDLVMSLIDLFAPPKVKPQGRVVRKLTDDAEGDAIFATPDPAGPEFHSGPVSAAKIKAIRALWDRRMALKAELQELSPENIALQFGISPSQVKRIGRREAWRTQ